MMFIRKYSSFILIFLLFHLSISAETTREIEFQKARKMAWDANYDDAIDIYEKMLDRDPRDVEAMISLGRVLSWKKEYDKALALYENALKIMPSALEAHLEILRIKSWQKQYVEAVSGLQKLKVKHPKNLDLLTQLGMVLAWQGEYENSIIVFEEAITYYPDNIAILKNMAKIYKWQGDTISGRKLNEKILRLAPNTIDALVDLAIIENKQGDYKSAIRYLEKAREIDSERFDIRAMLGVLYSWTAQLDDAITELQKSIALQKGSVAGYITLGRVLSWQKKSNEAISYFHKALEKDPKNIEAMVGLGNTYLYVNNWDMAENSYRNALQHIPNDASALKALKRLEHLKAPSLHFKYSYNDFKDYSPTSRNYSTRFKEHRASLEYVHHLSSDTTIHGKIEKFFQKQIDIPARIKDFHVKGDVLSVGLSHHFKDITMRTKLDFTIFENDEESAYKLSDTEYGYAGHCITAKETGKHYMSASFARELYLFIDLENDISKPAGLNTYTVADDYHYTDHLSILGAFAVIQYDTPKISYRKEYILRPKYRLPFFDKIRIEYQHIHYTAPQEKVHSGFISFLDSFQNGLKYHLEYEARYNSLQDSLQNTFSLFFSYDLGENIEMALDASLGIEERKDHDMTKSIQTYITWRF